MNNKQYFGIYDKNGKEVKPLDVLKEQYCSKGCYTLFFISKDGLFWYKHELFIKDMCASTKYEGFCESINGEAITPKIVEEIANNCEIIGSLKSLKV